MILSSVASDIGDRLTVNGASVNSPFEMLVSASGHARTDFKADIVDVHPLENATAARP